MKIWYNAVIEIFHFFIISEDVISYSKLDQAKTALEIGPGTGQDLKGGLFLSGNCLSIHESERLFLQKIVNSCCQVLGRLRIFFWIFPERYATLKSNIRNSIAGMHNNKTEGFLMKVFIIGGTGVISRDASKLLASKHEVYLFNRGQRPFDGEGNIHVIHGDVGDPEGMKRALEGQSFDCVIDFIAFQPADVERDIELFEGKTKQYIFISSASCYERPPRNLYITESTPLRNPYWDYSRAKIECEEVLMRRFRQTGFPVTVIRPSYTYNETTIPHIFNSRKSRFTVVDRILRNQKVILPGDGNTVWTLTHSRDFAKGLFGLVGNAGAIGEAFHITSDELLTWNQITQTIAGAVDKEADILHVPTDWICAYSGYEGGLKGDKIYSMVMDNSKLKRFVPEFQATVSFAEGIRESINYFKADSSRMEPDPEFNRMCDELEEAYRRGFECVGKALD